MKTRRIGTLTAGLLAALALAPAALLAQDATVERPASVRHRATDLHELLFSEGYRDLWITPIRLEVLDLGGYEGGITPTEPGGNQSETLHFETADGRELIFRSVDKFPMKALPDALRETPIGRVITDQTAAIFPTGELATVPLADAAGLLHTSPRLYIMPDDPRLDEFRGNFAGMVGLIFEKPNEGPDDTPGWGGFSKITGTDELVEKLDESGKDRIAAREYLTARLLDMVIGDSDRGSDQWRWAEVEGEAYDVWRPIPLDHDYAFFKADGLVIRLVAQGYDKLVVFGPELGGAFKGLVLSTRDFDRRVLADLPRAAWDSAVAGLQAALTDEVLAEGVARLPEPYRARRGDWLLSALRARRDQLPGAAGEYFALVNAAADVHGTFDGEAAEVERLEDGSVVVRLFTDRDAVLAGPAPEVVAIDAQPAPAAGAAAHPRVAYFERRFVPGETAEVRIYLHGGDDRALVRGGAHGGIRVRVIGGPGDDVLVDSSRAGSGRVSLYDARGENTLVGGPDTRIDRDPYEPEIRMEGEPPPEDGAEDADRVIPRWGRFQDLLDEGVGTSDFVEHKFGWDVARDYGSSLSVAPEIDHQTGAGIILGGGPAYTRYGFRRQPYAWRVALAGLYATGSGDVGAELEAGYRFENSPLGLSLEARAVGFDAYRFYGFGNDTDEIDSDLALVMQDELYLTAGLDWLFTDGSTLYVGPVARHVDPRFDDQSPAARLRPIGTRATSLLGGRLDLRLERAGGSSVPRDGFRLLAGGSAFPAAADLPESFAEAHAEGRAYLPVLARSVLALRAGGKRVWGDFPVFEAAFLGGSSTLRGFGYQRLAGDAALFGGAELRTLLTRTTLFVRGDLGVLGFVDVGRVYLDGESPGGWHSGVGAGLWFSSLGRSVGLTYANGEDSRLYLRLGMPF